MRNKGSLNEPLLNLKGISALVIGDSALDRYSVGAVNRISPDAPVPLVEVQREFFYLGNSANAAIQLSSLGVDIRYITVVGEDPEGEMLLGYLKRGGMSPEGVVMERGYNTQIVHRVLAGRQQVIMIQRNPKRPIRKSTEAQVIKNIKNYSKETDIIILSDRGLMLTDEMISAAVSSGSKVIANSNSENLWKYNGVYAIRMNRSAAEAATGISYVNETSIRNMGLEISSRTNCRYLLITWLEDGAYIFTGDSINHIPPSGYNPSSFTGIGDMITAVLAATVASGVDFITASRIAYYAGSVAASENIKNFLSIEKIESMLRSDEFSKWSQLKG
ncbi:MAG: hypothetical protein JRN19_06655 [Nitrososphaerota archaeon]|nr:hypothetical protein [Nitrososphaerota archaeon]MDG7049047.1 hypothetical protein [Nitrososphaerota archaeon]MDG7052111.1 hypothetical protein [Nitrososphaerota archaeon]